MKSTEIQVAQAIKSVARNQQIKSYIRQSDELYPLLLQVAKRFVTGENRDDGIVTAQKLIEKDYLISLEYMGENTMNVEACQDAKNEFLKLIDEMGSLSMGQTVSLDLSHIGLNVHPKTAYTHLLELARNAQKHGITLMISMEESAKTNDILDIYKKTTEQYSNVGITIQTYLYRSINDIKNLIHYPGKIRLVKGAYQESSDKVMSRSKELNNRYLELVEFLIDANHPLSIATHDEMLIREIENRQYLQNSNVELEMLYGIRPDLLKNIKEKGYNCKVYLTYGNEWYLYLCHRIAEYPENLFLAITDLIDSSLTEEKSSY